MSLPGCLRFPPLRRAVFASLCSSSPVGASRCSHEQEGGSNNNNNNNMSASLVRATIRAVSKRKLQATRAALTLTPSAVNKIKQLLQDEPGHIGLKVAVRTRGCNGLSYALEYTKSKGPSDEEVVQDVSSLPTSACFLTSLPAACLGPLLVS
ncbi:iron-sulfur cluster assembly 1 homolog, mitochondrial isoform X2 [Ascaphus truei]|uniref:iron-sulfur cluster assembly 1 homolog, mitochondrial isoform X2 n=1 Tax=Ascaphus truei TaxID=8439 RepID=UPI003F59D488